MIGCMGQPFLSEILCLAYVFFVLSQFSHLTDARTDISLIAKTALHRCARWDRS